MQEQEETEIYNKISQPATVPGKPVHEFVRLSVNCIQHTNNKTILFPSSEITTFKLNMMAAHLMGK